MTTGFDVDVSGPVFDGTAASAFGRAAMEAEEAVAVETANRVRDRLGEVLKNPTGFYESSIQTDRAVTGFVVDDSGVVYGPWLEGTSSRNARSRFKGYATFRRTRDAVQRDVVAIAGPIIDRVARELS